MTIDESLASIANEEQMSGMETNDEEPALPPSLSSSSRHRSRERPSSGRRSRVRFAVDDEEPDMPLGSSGVEDEYGDEYGDDDGYDDMGGEYDDFADQGDMYDGFEDSAQAEVTEEERKQQVIKLLADLDDLEGRGYAMPKRFNHTSDPDEMEYVRSMGTEFLRRKSGVKISKNILTGVIGVLEMVNSSYDPLGIKLDGFGDNVNENINDYEDVLWRLWQRYGQSFGDNHPLIELFMMLGMAGFQTHMMNSWAERQIAANDEREQEQQRARNVPDGPAGFAPQSSQRQPSHPQRPPATSAMPFSTKNSASAMPSMRTEGHGLRPPAPFSDVMNMAQQGPPGPMEPFPDLDNVDLSGMPAPRGGNSGAPPAAAGSGSIDDALNRALQQADSIQLGGDSGSVAASTTGIPPPLRVPSTSSSSRRKNRSGSSSSRIRLAS